MSTLPTLYNDLEYKIEYNPVNNKYRFNRNWVGPHTHIDVPVADYVYTEANSIFLNTSTGTYPTSTGLIAAPFTTRTAAANACTASKTKVLQINSKFDAEDLSGINNAYFEGFYTSTGAVATYTLRTLDYTPSNSNTIYVKKTGSDANAGTEALPCLTLTGTTGAISKITASKKSIMILDSETYIENAFIFTGNFTGLYAALGQAPTIQFSPTVVSYSNIEHYIDSANTASAITPVQLSNGSVVFAWSRSNALYYKIIDSTGATIKNVTSLGNYYPTILSLSVLDDDEWVVAWSNTGNSYAIQYCVLSKIGTVIAGPQWAYGWWVSNLSCAVQSTSNNIVFVYNKTTEGTNGRFIILDKYTNVKTAEKVFEANQTFSMHVKCFSDDSFVIAYCHDSLGPGTFKIYNAAGDTVIKDSTQIRNALGYEMGLDVFSDDRFILAYQDYDTHYLYYSIFDSAGNIQGSEGTTTMSGTDAYPVVLSDDSFILFNNAYFILYDADGTALCDPTYYPVGPVGSAVEWHQPACKKDAIDFLMAYQDTDDGSRGKYVSKKDITWSPIKVSVAATINGIIFDGEDSLFAKRMFDATAKITRKFCELKNATASITPTSTYATYTTSGIDSRNCLIHNNAAGDYTEENTGILLNNAYYKNIDGNALHIKGTAANTDDINIQYNTFFDNYAGLQLEDNQGTKETVKNNIFASNANYDILAETAMTTTYSILTGNVTNCTLGASTTKSNPLFVNEGALDESYTDLRVKLRVLGDYSTSPAYQGSDASSPDRDTGCWDAIPAGPITTWSSIVITKPVTGFDITYDIIGGTLTKLKSGEISSGLDAITEVFTIKHDCVTNANFIAILEMLNCGNNQIRFYGDPYTHPDDFLLCRIIYEKIKGFTKHWRLSRTGRQEVQLSFGRSYE